MKFLPQDKKKQIIYAIVLLVSMAGTLYLNVFLPASKNSLPVNQTFPQTEAMAALGKEPPPATTSSSNGGVRAGGLLPYGTQINTKFLETEAFQALKRPIGVSVSVEELGKPNLFNPAP